MVIWSVKQQNYNPWLLYGPTSRTLWVENLYSHIGGRSMVGKLERQSVCSCCIGKKSVLKPTSYIANI